MESMAESLFNRVEITLQTCLADSNLRLDDIYGVEVVGGSTRIPAIKQLIEKVFRKTPSTTLNQDEAVARGCALQCAMLSPAFKVREFSITDVQPYSIRLVWQDESGQEGDMEVFPKNHQVPFSKMLTFYRREPFTLQAQYTDPASFPDPIIGNYTIQKIAPGPEGECQKVKVKVRVNLHGLFTIASATLTEKKEAVEEPAENMETEEKQKNSGEGDAAAQGENQKTPEQEGAPDQKMETDKPAEGAPPAKNEGGEKKVKNVMKTVELPINEVSKSHSATEMNNLVEREAQMVQADKLENERINAKNAVEEYVYDIRGRIYEELEKYISEGDREKLGLMLEDTENWLYEDGEDCKKQVYLDKLTELKKHGEPIKDRKREREELPRAFESLLSSIQLARKATEQFRSGEEKYSHLEAAQVEKVEKAITEKQEWVDKNMGASASTPLHVNLPISANQVKSEKGTFEALVNPIINKPKPKPKVEEPPPAEKKEGEEDKNAGEQTNGPKNNEQQQSSEKPTEPMDVD
ncbi:heat shock protein [Penaeus vannamei]|uniref:Heat shock protein n=2 Tax=Penaeus vannamei TaxID=6689 RepID=A0A3R7MCL9_PENVA|nr:heat shock protein [Penaeus vannamei]